MALLPACLLKPGRVLTDPQGAILINPVWIRGVALLLAADVSFVVGIHLLRSLRNPRKSLLPINAGLGVIAAGGSAVGGLGAWLLIDPWRPQENAGVVLPPPNGLDLLGFGSAILAILSLFLHRHTHDRLWAETVERRPSPERPQRLRERLCNGFFMGLIAGILVGTLAAVAAVAIAHALGSPPTHRVYYVIPIGTAFSAGVQVYFVEQGLRGRITAGKRFIGLGA